MALTRRVQRRTVFTLLTSLAALVVAQSVTRLCELTSRMRSMSKYPTARARTNRYKNSFVLYALSHFQSYTCVYDWTQTMKAYWAHPWGHSGPLSRVVVVVVVVDIDAQAARDSTASDIW